ncbi:MAG: hypothetical protein RIT81_18575 [Deltaproteobacteria bacterium]
MQLEQFKPLAFPALFTLAFACGTGGGDEDNVDAPRDAGSTALGRDGGFRDGGEEAGGRDGGFRDGGVANALCPPSDTTGTNVGAIFPDLALPDCAGNMRNLQDPCERKAAYYFVYADW